jgi:hypothetical protein
MSATWTQVPAYDIDCCRCGLRYRTVGQAPTHCVRCHEALRAACCCRAVDLKASRAPVAHAAVAAHKADVGVEE